MFRRLAQARGFRSGVIVLCAMGMILLVAVGSSPLLANPGTVTVRVDPATDGLFDGAERWLQFLLNWKCLRRS